jgi:predicted permease
VLTDPTIPYSHYLEIRQRTMTLDGVYGYQLNLAPISMKAEGTASAERIFGGLITTNYFIVLGLSPAAGRLFTTQEGELPGVSPIVVLSHAFWTRRFHADPTIVGQTLTLNGYPFAIVGVAPEGFLGTGVLAPDVWGPTAMTSVIQPGDSQAWLHLMLGGRLRRDVSIAQAAAEIDTIGRSLPRMVYRRRAGAGAGDESVQLVGASPIPGNLRLTLAGFLALLLALVSSVLVITCANVAGILLARATARQREMAVRVAIGAGRARLIRQLLTETLLLFAVGGAAGLLLARAMTSMLMSALPAFPQPVAMSLRLDGRVIAFTLGVSLVAALLSGLAPGRAASKADVVAALKDDSHPPDRLRMRSAFVIAQVALSILLVVVAGLLARAMERATLGDQGFDPRGVEVASVDLSLAGYTNNTGPAFARALLERLRLVPGVQAATLAEGIPSANRIRGMSNEGVTVPGVPPPDEQPFFAATWHIVDPGFFATLGLPLLAGRDFDAGDRAGTQPVVILPEYTALRLWPGREAVGQYVELQTRTMSGGELSTAPPRVTRLLVVGVARDVGNARGRGRGDRAMPAAAVAMYMPLAQRYTPRLLMLARSADGHRLTGEIRALLASVDPNLPIITAETLDEHLLGRSRRSCASRRRSRRPSAGSAC